MRPESVREVARAYNIACEDPVYEALAPEIEYRVREIIQDATKFMRHARRSELTSDDVNLALRYRNLEPLHGHGGRLPPVRTLPIATGTRVRPHYDPVVPLSLASTRVTVQRPRAPTVAAHWLAVGGKQPLVPMNPTREGVERRLGEEGVRDPSMDAPPGVSTVPVVVHTLSKELQTFFHHVERAMGADAEMSLRTSALTALATDPGIHELVPYLLSLAHDKVTVNARGPRKVKVFDGWVEALTGLVRNRGINLLPYLDLLLPTACTLLLADRLSPLPVDDHWSVRRKAARLLRDLTNRFSPPPPQLLPQLARTLRSVHADPSHALATHYGAVVGAAELGVSVANEVVVRGVPRFVEMVRRAQAAGGDDGNGASGEAGEGEGVMDIDGAADRSASSSVRAYEARMLLDATREACVQVSRAARRGEIVPRVPEAQLAEAFGEDFLERVGSGTADDEGDFGL